MSSLGASLLAAASALDTFQYAVSVSQNNIGNATTPGYTRQTVDLQADPFDPAAGVSGGVRHGPLIDSRDLLAESDVWQQSGAQGDADARTRALTAVENAMPVAEGGGIPAALNTFLSDASAWSTSPASGSARQTVMLAADSLARSFTTTAAGVAQASQSVSQSIDATVDQINRLSIQVAGLNADIRGGGLHDAGMQAQLYSSLETLSGLVNLSVLHQPDGSVNVTLSGGAALVIGNQPYALTVDSGSIGGPSVDPQASPDVIVKGPDGAIVNAQISSGSLHGLLEVRNVTIPGLIGDASQPGALNELAATLARQVNLIVGQGSISAGVPASSGLFTLDSTRPSAAAATLAVDPLMTAAQLPAIDGAGIPNGVPLALAALANPQPAGSGIGPVSFTTFYGNTAALVGSQLSQSKIDQELAGQSLAQAQSMRQSQSGVSLDTEAVNLLQFQQGYQAVAKMVSTLAQLMQTLMNMIPT